jgi:hypothetical protein
LISSIWNVLRPIRHLISSPPELLFIRHLISFLLYIIFYINHWLSPHPCLSLSITVIVASISNAKCLWGSWLVPTRLFGMLVIDSFESIYYCHELSSALVITPAFL